MSNVTIMSGLPGSGKSFHVRSFVGFLLSEGEEGIIISADHRHCATLQEVLSNEEYEGIPFHRLGDEDIQNALDNYEFKPTVLETAHPQCFKAFINKLLSGGDSNIVVDNTNIHAAEIAPYYLAAQAFGATVEIIRVEAPVELCIKRNVHDVPKEAIVRMNATFSEMKGHPWKNGVTIPKQHMPWWTSRSV